MKVVRSATWLVALVGAAALVWSLSPPRETVNATGETAAADPKAWHRLVSILQYLQTDYPAAVKSQSKSELTEQLSFADEAVAMARDELGPAGRPFLPELQSLRERVSRAEDPGGVSKGCVTLVDALVQAGGLSRSPPRSPDLAHGKALYAADCAVCHGLDGKSQVEVARSLNPRPSDLQSSVMDNLTPYKVFTVLTFGVEGTSMPSYPTLSEQDRWELAFYVFTLRQRPCLAKAASSSLEELSNSTDASLGQAHGGEAVACLRGAIPKASEGQTLELAREGVENAVKLATLGNAGAARQALVDAYLAGVEPVEPLLRSRDPDLVTHIEESFRRTRSAVDGSSAGFEHEARGLLRELDQARHSGSSLPRFWSVFWLALMVLTREGFEATIVVAALLAVLKKMEQPEQRRVVNFGWISALVAGALVYIFGRKLFAGADRELLEGGFALFASGMLIYAALWLNARSNIRKFMGELRERMHGALGRGSSAGLFMIAFTAVFRESLETAVFLEGLSIDSARGAAWGAVAGLLLMVAFTVFVNRVGYKLPMKAMFTASTVLLYVTAIVLLGKGVHALQEVNVLPLHPMRLFTVDLLGLYPDAFSFLPQLALALAPWLWQKLRAPAQLTLRAPRSSNTRA